VETRPGIAGALVVLGCQCLMVIVVREGGQRLRRAVVLSGCLWIGSGGERRWWSCPHGSRVGEQQQACHGVVELVVLR